MWKHKHSHGEKRNMQLFARDAWFVCHENIYTHFNLMSLSHTHTHTEKKEVTTTEWRQKWLLHNATPTTKKKHRRNQRIQMAKTTYRIRNEKKNTAQNLSFSSTRINKQHGKICTEMNLKGFNLLYNKRSRTTSKIAALRSDLWHEPLHLCQQSF